MLSARLDEHASFDATLTPRQRELLDDGKQHARLEARDNSEHVAEPQRGSKTRRSGALRRFDSVDSALRPTPPSREPAKPFPPRTISDDGEEKKLYKDNRLGFKAGSQRQTLEELLGNYQQNQAQLENLQKGLKARGKEATGSSHSDSNDNSSACRAPISHHHQHERQMHGLDEATRAKVRKYLLRDPEARTPAQVKTLVEWTLEIDLFYGLTMQQRTQLCSQSVEAEEYQAGDVVLARGDLHSGVQVLFEGKCAIYLDRTNNKANEANKTNGIVDRASAGGGQRRVEAKHTQHTGGSSWEKEQGKEEREVSFSKYIEESAKARRAKGVRKTFALGATKSLAANDMQASGGGVSSVSFRSRKVATLGLDLKDAVTRRRRNAIGGDSALPPVQVCFLPGDDIGAERSFHNIEAASTKAEGYRTASHTVQATESTLLVVVSSPEMLHLIKGAYMKNLDEKVAFLKSLPSYKASSHVSMVAMARLMKRKWYTAEAVVVQEGDEADSVNFCVEGQLKVIKNLFKKKEKVLNVLGPGSQFGDWGVVNDVPRAASMVTVTNAQILVIVRRLHSKFRLFYFAQLHIDLVSLQNGFNFKSTADKRVIDGLKVQASLVQAQTKKKDAHDGMSGGIKVRFLFTTLPIVPLHCIHSAIRCVLSSETSRTKCDCKC
eukprot:COSAG02_NODE_3034_length_7504_cov_13.653477_6_plen_664_part_00